MMDISLLNHQNCRILVTLWKNAGFFSDLEAMQERQMPCLASLKSQPDVKKNRLSLERSGSRLRQKEPQGFCVDFVGWAARNSPKIRTISSTIPRNNQPKLSRKPSKSWLRLDELHCKKCRTKSGKCKVAHWFSKKTCPQVVMKEILHRF